MDLAITFIIFGALLLAALAIGAKALTNWEIRRDKERKRNDAPLDSDV
jgi:hypothetical protein